MEGEAEMDSIVLVQETMHTWLAWDDGSIVFLYPIYPTVQLKLVSANHASITELA